MLISNAYHKRLHDLIYECRSKNSKTLLFFKGFPVQFYKELENYNVNCLYDNNNLNSGYIEVDSLFDSKTNLMIKFLTSNEKLIWGYYEEFIVLTDMLQNIKEQFNGDIYIINNNLFDQYYFLDIPIDIQQSLFDYFSNEDSDMRQEFENYLKLYSNGIKYSEQDFAFSFINKHFDEGIEEIDFYQPTEIVFHERIPEFEPIFIKDYHFELYKKNLQIGDNPNQIQLIVESDEDMDWIYPVASFAQLANIELFIYRQNGFSDLEEDHCDDYLPILKKYWGQESIFRALKFYKNPDENNELVDISQGQIISDIIKQSEKALVGQNDYRDLFITSPTGSGKSLLFQIPSIYLATSESHAITIVITPLIALMQDQVSSLEKEHQIDFATFINSDIPFQERERRIYGIKNGEYSIIYVSPEFFMANSIETIFGDRKIGLFVIDEAHLVTTWGRDFRADYWYLGDFVEKLRKNDQYLFPILCLTATAVYLGNDDIVYDTITSLNLRNHKIYLGNIRRDDIIFNIHYITKDMISGNIDEFKLDKAIEAICCIIEKGMKCIVYCPYASQAEDLYIALPAEMRPKVGKYYGKLDKTEKSHSYEEFKNGNQQVMICTKAFGMGVDINDVEMIYHYAPTGNLADYVQEIGRAARKNSLQGIAMTDFTDKDMKYIRMLYGMSNIKHYQLREMIRKLYQIFKEKKNRNFLVSTEAFSYLFHDEDVENKVKNGLLLIAKDLEQKSKFPVLIVRPKSMFTKNFIHVPNKIESEFLYNFGKYVKKADRQPHRVIPSNYHKNGDTVVYNLGTIYEMDMAKVWEEKFNDLTFPQFKWKFFNGQLITFENDEHISPRVNIVIYFNDVFEDISTKLKNYLQKLTMILARFKSRSEFFTKKQFREAFIEVFGVPSNNKELPNLLLDLFVADVGNNIGFNQSTDYLKFVQYRKAQNRDELEYRVMNSNYSKLQSQITRYMAQCSPNMNDKTYSTYVPLGRGNKQHEMVTLAVFLELFGLASYEIIGGKNTEIFIRVNDPSKLRKIPEGTYRNTLLSNIERKRKRSELILSGFMRSNLTTEQRWDLIEDYFLGREQTVSATLGMNIDELQTSPS